jgi:tRNA threonylcarbamoyladenosine biosynthesis protein TsaB
MMLTLAVDTTAELGSIALADDEGLREEVAVDAPQGFSQVLFGEMEGLLKRQGVRLAEIELFAGASGPGSFTGVRVGLAAIKGLAEVLGRQVVAVSNLEALAEFGSGNARAVVIDARRGEVYAAVYDAAGNQIIPEAVLPLEKFREMLAGRDTEWISDLEAKPRPLAAAIARIAIRRATHGHAQDPAAIEANYVRRSDAELLWKEI